MRYLKAWNRLKKLFKGFFAACSDVRCVFKWFRKENETFFLEFLVI